MSNGAWNKAKRDLYSALIDKTDGEARSLIRSESRDGMFGYMKLNLYFTEVSGLGIGERRAKVLKPTKVKREEDIFQAVLDRAEEINGLER